jgi:AcrR family transcriptional regulator
MGTPLPSTEKSRRRPSQARGRILEAVEALLLEGGVEGVSIRRLSARCGYTAPTIYYHFGDKTGLIGAALEARFRVVLEVMEAIPHGADTVVYLREMAAAFIRFALANPDHYRLLTVPRPEGAHVVPSAEACRELVKRALEQLGREGSLATDDIEAAFQITWAVLHGLISLHLIRPDYTFAEGLVESALDMVEDGLLRRERRAR